MNHKFNIEDIFEISITPNKLLISKDFFDIIIRNLIDLKNIDNNVKLKIELQTNKFVFQEYIFAENLRKEKNFQEIVPLCNIPFTSFNYKLFEEDKNDFQNLQITLCSYNEKIGLDKVLLNEKIKLNDNNKISSKKEMIFNKIVERNIELKIYETKDSGWYLFLENKNINVIDKLDFNIRFPTKNENTLWSCRINAFDVEPKKQYVTKLGLPGSRDKDDYLGNISDIKANAIKGNIKIILSRS